VNVGVGGAVAKLEARGDTIHRHWERLVSRLRALNLVNDYAYRPKGHAYYLQRPDRQVQMENAFVAGDAAGLATSDMGEGIAPAIQSGLRVAEAIATGEDVDLSGIRRWSQPPLIGRLLSAAGVG
jgi:flavin-dependent dehydrogenase